MEPTVQTKKNPARELPKINLGEPPPIPNALPRDVAEFCAAHGLAGAVHQALVIAARCFDTSAPEIELSRDPDTGEQSVVVLVTTTKSPEEASDVYELYVKEWVRVADRAARAAILLSYIPISPISQ
jgi:hypothetical protein